MKMMKYITVLAVFAAPAYAAYFFPTPMTAEAFEKTLKAAEEGNVYEQVGLALAYMDGRVVEQDDAEARKWMRKAAEQGNDFAIKNLEGGKERFEATLKATEEGSPMAAPMQLFYAYLKGVDVEKNEAEALKWLRKAVEAERVPGFASELLNRYETAGTFELPNPADTAELLAVLAKGTHVNVGKTFHSTNYGNPVSLYAIFTTGTNTEVEVTVTEGKTYARWRTDSRWTRSKWSEKIPLPLALNKRLVELVDKQFPDKESPMAKHAKRLYEDLLAAQNSPDTSK